MDLRVNLAVRMLDDVYSGLYRIVAISNEEVFFGVIKSDFKGLIKRGKQTHYSKPTAICSKLLILQRKKIEQLIEELKFEKIEIEVSNLALQRATHSPTSNHRIIERFNKSISAMSLFLDHSKLNESVIKNRSFKHMITLAVREMKCDPKYIYRQLQRLIQFGFSESSLIPHYYNSGGVGISRTYKEGASLVGAKPLAYCNAVNNGLSPKDERSGMREEWKTICALAIDKFPKPHPSIRKMYVDTITNYFPIKVNKEGGIVREVEIDRKCVPSYNQFIYFYRRRYTKIQRLKHKTTSHNFDLNHRGHTGRSSDGVGGPGHTYAIDSTLADIFLLSSLIRAQVLGRPIVYFIVCVFSGAIVGFYVCFDGPKWDSAKIALFCAAYDPVKLSELLGVPYFPVFRHQPGIPRVLLGDRGEYIGKNASATCKVLELDQEFPRPYFGKGKGDVEVQFKHLKDGQLNWVPGTHDARRIEMEQRKSKPLDATMTLQGFVMHISSRVREYNLTADMSDRLTDYMKADNVKPTPAGIWDWGFDNGIGYSSYIPENELIRTLLPKVTAKSSPHGIKLNGRIYVNPEDVLDLKLTTEARNFGETDINIWYYPGNIQNIFTDHGKEYGFRSVPRKGNDSSHISEEELEDVEHTFSVTKANLKHDSLEISVREHIIQADNIAASKSNTRESRPMGRQNTKKNQRVEAQILSHQTLPQSQDRQISIDNLWEEMSSDIMMEIYENACKKGGGIEK